MWHDEYDALNGGKLDLGAATDTSVPYYATEEVDGDTLYKRQFAEGWVYVNPTQTDMTGISCTAGRIANHSTFSTLESQSKVTSFDLDANRGVILYTAPVVSISATDATATEEGTTTGTFTFT